MIIKKGSLHNRGSNIIEELKDGRKYEETNISVKNKRMRRGETNKDKELMKERYIEIRK